jgi:hypothetical protein
LHKFATGAATEEKGDVAEKKEKEQKGSFLWNG